MSQTYFLLDSYLNMILFKVIVDRRCKYKISLKHLCILNSSDALPFFMKSRQLLAL